MNRETNPKVKAALLSSYGDITQGASGTGQVFLDALESKDLQVRNAALMALQHYKNDPSIMNRVEQFALNAEDIETFRKGVKVLTAITSTEEFSSLVENLMGKETMNRRAIFAIQQLANMGEVEDAVKKASLFMESRFDYEIRSTALKILIQHHQGDWLARAEELLTSFDPRIRYLTVTGFPQDLKAEAREFLQGHIQDEYDARVYFKIERLLNQ
jgi:HEAT repeat protein